MKSSTTRKTNKKPTPRILTQEEAREKTLHIYLYHDGWVVVENEYDVRSVHRTQVEAIKKGRAMAKKRHGQLVIHKRNARPRKFEQYWSGPVVFEPLKLIPPSFPPVNATRKEIERAVK